MSDRIIDIKDGSKTYRLELKNLEIRHVEHQVMQFIYKALITFNGESRQSSDEIFRLTKALHELALMHPESMDYIENVLYYTPNRK